MIASTTSTDTTKRNSHRQSLLSMTPSLARTLAKIYGGCQAFAYCASRLSCSPHFVRRRDRLEAPQELQLLIAKHSRPGRAKSRGYRRSRTTAASGSLCNWDVTCVATGVAGQSPKSYGD